MKKYKIGMYGGKFLPLHKGHIYCIETATQECEKVYVILFYGGIEEEKALEINKEEYLSVDERKRRLVETCLQYDNAIPAFIDVSKLRLSNGKEDWDAETPLVRKIVGDELNAIYSSEPSYDEYFKRAYPEAVHRIVDDKRIHYPISGTKIRKMKKEKERDLWIV